MTNYKLKLTQVYETTSHLIPGIVEIDQRYYVVSEEGSIFSPGKRKAALNLLKQELRDTRAKVGELELSTEFIASERRK